VNFADLTQVALLGTERQAIPTPSPVTAFAQLQAQVDINQRGHALLSLAGLTAQYERVGHRPACDHGAPPLACPPEQRTFVGDRASSLLVRLLAGEHPELLSEWLALASRANQVASPEALAALLSAGSTTPELRPAIRRVAGERGRWLANQNPDWAWIGGADDANETVWYTGDRQARVTFLERLRQTNPTRATELLAETWKDELPDDRLVFLPKLATGLSSKDEPFLELALDDKRKEVRRSAAALLTRLTDSRLVQRMTDRVRPLLAFSPGEPGSVLKLRRSQPPVVRVTLPAECDKPMQRDGIELRAQGGFGEKAWWLIQMLEIVPLETWTRAWTCTPEAILAGSHSEEWTRELFEAWTRAAVRQRNAAWAEVLFPAALAEQRFDKLECLLGALPPVQRETRLAALLADDTPQTRHLHGTLIAQCQHDWSHEFSRTVLAFMRRESARETGDWPLRNQFKTYAPRLAPGTLPDAANDWPTNVPAWESWAKGVEEFLAMAQFRADLHSAIPVAP
jgi:hypothetical protein